MAPRARRDGVGIRFAVSTTFPPMVTGLGIGVAYGMYSFAAALSFFFVLFLIRETRGKELEEME